MYTLNYNWKKYTNFSLIHFACILPKIYNTLSDSFTNNSIRETLKYCTIFPNSQFRHTRYDTFFLIGHNNLYRCHILSLREKSTVKFFTVWVESVFSLKNTLNDMHVLRLASLLEIRYSKRRKLRSNSSAFRANK